MTSGTTVTKLRLRAQKAGLVATIAMIAGVGVAVLPNSNASALSLQTVYTWTKNTAVCQPNQVPCIPTAIASQNGRTYVADVINGISVYGLGGNLLFRFHTQPSPVPDIVMIRGIAIDTQGNIYVSDMYNNNVQKYSRSGQFISSFGSQGSNNGEFIAPQGITIDRNGNIYVADLGNSRIQKFNSNGQFLMKFGSYGLDAGQLQLPSGVAVDSLGNIYVTDYRLQKFSPNGTFLMKFNTSPADDPRVAYQPDSVVLDSQNSEVITTNSWYVARFSTNGQYRGKFSSPGSGPQQILPSSGGPSKVAVDQLGNILISDAGNSRISSWHKSYRLVQ